MTSFYKRIRNLLGSIIAVPLGILFMIIILSVSALLVIPVTLLTFINNIILRNALKPLIQEYRDSYGLDILYASEIRATTPKGLYVRHIPLNIFSINKFIRKIYLELGSTNHHSYFNNTFDSDFILNIKKKCNIVTFYSMRKNQPLLDKIHLYNLQTLSQNELESLLSLNISDYQKTLIRYRYFQPPTY